jgi:hypothetical protein
MSKLLRIGAIIIVLLMVASSVAYFVTMAMGD